MADDVLKLIQVTDAHVGEDLGRMFEGFDTLASLQAVLAHARRNAWPSDLVLATGDLAGDGTPAAYRRLKELFGALEVPVYCLPGNHDQPSAMAEHLVGGRVAMPGSACHGAWQIVLLDSTVEGWEAGRLDDDRLGSLDAALGRRPDLYALVCLHHQPVSVGTAMDRVPLVNPEAFFEVLDRHGQVRGVVWGHIHHPFDDERRGVRLMGSPSTCIQYKGEEELHRTERPPAYRWLNLHADGRIETGIHWVEDFAAAR
ncbi:MAG: phosphodiesterase [Alphaproteobacteria bacterium]